MARRRRASATSRSAWRDGHARVATAARRRRRRCRMIAAQVAERATTAAGPDAFALVTRERSLMLRFAAGRPTQATAIDDVTVEIAILVEGHVGRASTNEVDDAALA